MVLKLGIPIPAPLIIATLAHVPRVVLKYSIAGGFSHPQRVGFLETLFLLS